MSPNDHELYIHGHIEVPNLLGNDVNCSTEDGFSMLPGSQTTYSGTDLPADAIIPSETPVVVGDGVTIEAPAQ